MRCLKRYIAREVHASLRADLAALLRAQRASGSCVRFVVPGMVGV